MKNIFSSILFITLVLFTSFILAFLVGNNSIGVDLWDSIILKSWCLIFGVQLVVFLPSFVFKTDHYFDITGGITFILMLMLLTNSIISNDSSFFDPKLIPLFLISLWAVRLSSFLFLRVKRVGKDVRFDEIKTKFFRFMLAWIIQGFWVFMCLLPVITMVGSNKSTNLKFIAIGVLLWLVGWLVEVFSDIQKTRFNSNLKFKGDFINTGLWSISRHPNYFGEFVLWTGITLIAFPTFSGFQYLACLTPVFVYLLLNKISGVNLLEEIANKRWRDNKSYQEYKRKTPIFSPKIFKI